MSSIWAFIGDEEVDEEETTPVRVPRKPVARTPKPAPSDPYRESRLLVLRRLMAASCTAADVTKALPGVNVYASLYDLRVAGVVSVERDGRYAVNDAAAEIWLGKAEK